MTVTDLSQKRKIETIEVGFEVKKILDDDDDGFFRFEGLASTFGNIDLVDDVVEKGAFVESLNQKMPIVLWQHDGREPIGVPEIAQEVEEGLFVRARLPKEDSLVKGRVIPQVRVGSVRTMSIGFRVLEDEMRGRIRHIKKVDLAEFSLVTFPANPMAKVSGFKSATPFQDLPIAQRDRAWDSDAAIARIREFSGSVDSPSEDYRQAFFWFDSEKADEFGSYKLPYADVIDGVLTAIPRAIFAAKAAIGGARGGIDIPETDKKEIIRNIARYEDIIEDEQPSKSLVFGVERIDEIKTIRDFENALRESGAFTKNAAIAMVAKAKILTRGEPVEDDAEVTKALADINTRFEEVLLSSALNQLNRRIL